ncbi:MAG: TIR domain-containing protein [Pseudomonadota bacterium]
MSDIFLSYASDDQERAYVLAKALRSKGWSVWWDRTIPTGKRFEEVIDDALPSARCVVVMWSRASVQKDWVVEEAEEGKSRGILVPVLMDSVSPPRGFRRLQTANLVGWDGDRDSSDFQALMTDIARVLGPPPAILAESSDSEVDSRRIVAALVTYTWRPEGEIFPLREGKNFLGAGDVGSIGGANKRCDIHLPHDAKLSAEHAVILCRRGRSEVLDQQSSNGTFLDGALVPMQGAQLENYSELRAGATSWTFVKLQDSTAEKDRTTMDIPSNLVPDVQRLLDTLATPSSRDKR